MVDKNIWVLTEEDIMWVLEDLMFRGKDLKLTEQEKMDIFRDVGNNFGGAWSEEVEDILSNNLIVIARGKE